MRGRAFVILLLSALLSGCNFDNPLTGGPTKELNTWLLGVWEAQNDKGDTARTVVLPMANDRYDIWFHSTVKGKKKTYNYEGWISRVGHSQFLTLKCLSSSSGDAQVGSYTFIHYQVVDQLHLFTRGLQLDSPQEASSFELRKEVRRKLKDKTLYGPETTAWTRVNDVYWDQANQTEKDIEPLRNPQGYVEKKKNDKKH